MSKHEFDASDDFEWKKFYLVDHHHIGPPPIL